MAGKGRRRSPGEGSIYQGADGRWYASLEVGGKGERRRRRFVGKTRESVRKKMMDAQRDGVARGAGSKIRTITDLADAWLSASERRVEHRTFASYTDVVSAYIKPQLGTLRKEQLEPPAVEKALRAWINAPRRDKRKNEEGELLRLSPTSVRYNLTVLRTMLNWAVKMREIPYNPADAVEPPRATEYEAEVLTPEEFADLLAFARQWASGDYSTHLLVAAATGVRRGELCGLQRGDIALEEDVVEVNRSVVVRRDSYELAIKAPKGGKSEAIPVPHLVMEALAEWFDLQDRRLGSVSAMTPVFDTSGALSHPDTLGKDIWKMLHKWGVRRVRLHDLRHSFGSWLATGGASDRVLRAQLRHASQKMTDRYTKRVDLAQRAAAEALDQRLRVAMAHHVAHQAAISEIENPTKR